MLDIADFFLDDTLVPAVFITDYMPDLGRTALNVYLMARLHMDADRRVKAQAVRSLLGLEEEEFKAAVCELAGRGIVATESDFKSFVMLDLKRQALDKYYSRKTSDTMEDVAERTEKQQKRMQLVNSVKDTFFHGLMGPSWLHSIDRWFEQYHFAPEVIYQMFTDAAARGTLKGPNYLNAVAEDYYRNNVRTFRDLVAYKERYKKALEISTQVGRRLNKSMTIYDENLVKKWVADYGYDMDVIELALEKAVQIKEPNLNYFDSILRSWHEAGLKTPEEIKKLEANRRHMRTKQRKKAGSASRREEMFEQREYEDSFFDQFSGISYINDEGQAEADDQEKQDLKDKQDKQEP